MIDLVRAVLLAIAATGAFAIVLVLPGVFLADRLAGPGRPPPLDLATQPGLAGLAQHATPPPDLRRYDALLQRPASQAVPAVTS